MMVNKRFFKSLHLIKSVLVLCFFIICTGCQLTQEQSVESQYSDYYLRIKNLSSDELLSEIQQQKQNLSLGYYDAEVHLAMLYGLPNSPIYNVYTAKTKLNQWTLNSQQSMQISSADFGFITMMKDQLNRQIMALNKLLQAEQLLQEFQISQKIKLADENVLKTQLLKLKQQIIQLKNIELNINDQEQKL